MTLVEEKAISSLPPSYVSDTTFWSDISLLLQLTLNVERTVSEIIEMFESNIFQSTRQTKSNFKKRKISWEPSVRLSVQSQLDKIKDAHETKNLTPKKQSLLLTLNFQKLSQSQLLLKAQLIFFWGSQKWI